MPFTHLTPTTPLHEVKAQLFKALGHPIRVRLLELLIPGERAVADLLTDTGLEASLASQHLAVLRRTGLVTARREGNTVTYRLADPSVVDLLTAARTFLATTLAGTQGLLSELDRPLGAPAEGSQPSTTTPR
ncbi:ArsR/SmtB family transcription factor [Cellulomonas carbonis]|uniref:ArsR family transcriptional regulator n=1 Tax=Cellulomonas carbonis T26 TaxID=947969 RepID=A0A0A0BUV8_9CELL|nr:metalloregulator ArsR/SmtB family transcription factor [Cellulomonas carbonis]KGM10949.1 ArsR family transcriptional regulator [Cellulomonas carbonis T26]GGC02312.1 putative transcriptional regulatory protein ArsR [Cellulomonas carbonis]